MKFALSTKQSGKIGYILLWLVGVTDTDSIDYLSPERLPLRSQRGVLWKLPEFPSVGVCV